MTRIHYFTSEIRMGDNTLYSNMRYICFALCKWASDNRSTHLLTGNADFGNLALLGHADDALGSWLNYGSQDEDLGCMISYVVAVLGLKMIHC